MKDSYSFDRDREGLDVAYEKHARAYDRMMERCGLEWYRVEADVGMMGGHGSDEYMAPCAAGENEVVHAPGYAANIEVASADPQPVTLPAPLDAPERVSTPGMTTIEAVVKALGEPAGALLKAFPIVLSDGEMKLVMVRGDHRVNEIKLQNTLGQQFRAASADRGFGAPRPARLHRPGRHRSAGAARRRDRARVIRDGRQRARRAPARRRTGP